MEQQLNRTADKIVQYTSNYEKLVQVLERKEMPEAELSLKMEY